MTAKQIPVWTWRDAIRQAGVPPLTKLVCYSIANYLSDCGRGCFPSIATLMADTGLSNRSLATHIQSAVEFGLLEPPERQIGENGRFRGTVYRPRFPAQCVLPKGAADMPVTHSDDAMAEAFIDRVKEVHAGEKNAVSATHSGSPPCEGESRGEADRVNEPRELGAVHRVNLLHAELSNKELSKGIYPPNPPPSGGDYNDADETLIERVEAVCPHGEAVERMVRPLLAKLRVSADDKVAALAQIAEAAVGLTAEQCAKAIAIASEDGERHRAKSQRVLDAIKAVRQHGLMIIIRRGTPEWQRWAEHDRAAGARFPWWDQLQQRGVPSQWPPAKGRAA